MPLSFTIPPVTSVAGDRLDAQIEALGLPSFSLGLLENVVRKLACIQNSHEVELRQLHHLVFCADHGVYDRSHQANIHRMSSTDHVLRILNGQAPVAIVCRKYQVELSVIDCGLKGPEIDLQAMLYSQRVGAGTRDFSMMPAMTEAQLHQAVSLGVGQAALRLAEGTRVLSFGALGLGNTTSAAAMCIALLGLTPEIAVINKSRLEPLLQYNKVEVLTQALALHRHQLSDGWSVARHLGGFEIAAIMGAMAITAELGGMFLVDGFACSAALLALHRLYPNILDYAQFSHQSCHIAQHAIMKHLGQRALLNLNLGLGEGTGSVLAWPLVVSAVDCLNPLGG
ncbi:nicotinate-nucleotide--dimethylbenzimidazole phosphoribosyltransferase [Reinekea sp.]|jgi:nicotinate-nucleotide--dimethylbenzimidazole phosphoribosyltransferase|uniref:nicotinate-nucleotide--dimethylbenzimidazole phosphoribosyltransferase n=1 Tax=Reinekea sp. TaxID=1970455 RepID=UPI002A7ED82F|nr:nicotinate-nucleotide--dimethylbenzimidazole phosphoribosyltransferase [Reinekea sp.]